MLAKALRPVFRSLKTMLKSSKLGRELLYDANNADEFSNLYEHEKMLCDYVRMEHYHEAIRRHIKPGDVVVDLGTGSGILSFMAARQNPKRIYAIDHSSFIDIARRIAAHNHIDGITFVRSHSREFKPREKVDVILHEQMGDALLNENMLVNILDLKRRLLKPTGLILPGSFELFLEPVSLKADNKASYLWENVLYGIDYGFLKGSPELQRYKPNYYHLRYIENGSIEHYLGEPEAILRFDLNAMDTQDDVRKTFDATRKVVRAGSLDGFCVYFRAIFDQQTAFDTSPLSARTNWTTILYRTEARTCREGDEITYRFVLDDLARPETWTVSVL